jgi:hypothetical protein
MTMPPAAEKLVADLKAAAGAASQLEAAEADADRASLLVGIRDVADYAARVLVAFYGPDRRHTVQKAHGLRAAAGHVLNDAEVLDARGTEVPEPAPVLVLERIEARAVTGWARWHVLDAAGQLVGFVVEDHEWLGDTYGPATYQVAHNPTGEAFGALWRSEGHAAPQEALGALTAHLGAPGGPGRGQSSDPRPA